MAEYDADLHPLGDLFAHATDWWYFDGSWWMHVGDRWFRTTGFRRG